MKNAKRSPSSLHPTLELIHTFRKGMPYSRFSRIAAQSPFTVDDWSKILHLTVRSLQRYKKERLSFDPMLTERIILISQLNELGRDVFGDAEKYALWIDSKIIALGGIKPKELLDTNRAIEMVKDELTDIDDGILA